jgi:CHAT domain-containing protein
MVRLALLPATIAALSAMVATVTPALSAEPAPAGQDLLGAACQSMARPDIAADPGAPPPVYLACGTGGRPDAAVALVPRPLSLPPDPAARRTAIERTMALTAAGRDAAARRVCGTGAWTAAADGVDILIRPCTSKDGGWPEIEVIADLGRFLGEGDGAPAAAPAMLTVMSAQSGRPSGAPPLGDADTLRRALDTAFAGKLRLVAGADYARYGRLLEEARLADSRRNYRAAEEDYREALDIEERVFGRDTVGAGTTLVGLALAVSNQGRADEAAALFRRADPLVQRSPSATDRGRFFTYMAFDAANAGRAAEAMRYAEQATEIWRGLGSDKETDLGVEDIGAADVSRAALRGELAHSLNVEAAMALRLGRLAEAEAMAKEALGIIGQEASLPLWWRPEVLTTLGEVYAREGRMPEAEESLRGALILQARLFGDTAPTASTLLTLGRIYAENQLPDEAVHAYRTALPMLEKDPAARSVFLADQMASLVDAANALATRDPSQKAELAATIVRAVQLTEGGVAEQTITRAAARLAAGDPAIEKLERALQDAERRRDAARLELAQETSLPDDERGADKEAQLLAAFKQANEERDMLAAQLQHDFPGYAKLADPGPVELAALQATLRPGEAMVLFGAGRRQAFVILVRAGEVVARPLDTDTAKLDRAVGELRRAFAVRGGHEGVFDVADAFALYRTLFAPIENALAGVDHLIVVPSGALASLPPAILVTARPAAGAAHDYRRAEWLVRRFAVSEVPSIQALAALRAGEGAASGTRPFLGIGNPAFDGKIAGGAPTSQHGSALAALGRQCRDAGPVPAALLRALAPLPETAGEVRAVAQAVGAAPGDVLLGDAATEGALRTLPLEQYRVLYFATHGLLPGELMCQTEPALALSPPATPATRRDQDGLLEASEVAGLRLKADLVVLSACNTAQAGDRFGGEALSGMAEAFFYAGARTLVASHWEVPSTATVRLMTGMFRRLGPTLAGGVAETLRQSQLQLIEDPSTAHPFFWGAFTVIGDGAHGAARAAAHPAGSRTL